MTGQRRIEMSSSLGHRHMGRTPLRTTLNGGFRKNDYGSRHQRNNEKQGCSCGILAYLRVTIQSMKQPCRASHSFGEKAAASRRSPILSGKEEKKQQERKRFARHAFIYTRRSMVVPFHSPLVRMRMRRLLRSNFRHNGCIRSKINGISYETHQSAWQTEENEDKVRTRAALWAPRRLLCSHAEPQEVMRVSRCASASHYALSVL
jgi:hypothetical protein